MQTRTLDRTPGFVAINARVPAQRLEQVEGRGKDIGAVSVKPLLVGAEGLLLEIVQAKGVKVPPHQHDDHESLIYLVRGRMRLVIDGTETVVGPGDAWIHPRGVPHHSEALEECVTIEVKTPPRKTW
ncbi:MAG: cupin domain-containing protein [Burkholderiales bacterium]|nr:cupin domain-containing protein [Burkholderiales bacterium]